MTTPGAPPILELNEIVKTFGANRVLDSAELTCRAGETQALLGANGAGKSTLIHIATGVYRPDAGTVRMLGEPVEFHRPIDAERAGISTVYQELSLIEQLNVAENLFLHREPRRGWLLDSKRLYEQADELLARLGIDLDPRSPVAGLSVARRQLVEIAKALARDARVLIMDEPTASLTAGEQERLFAILDDLRARGVAVLYVSHRLDEVFRVADRVTILRDGRLASSTPLAATSKEEIIEAMVGRRVLAGRHPGASPAGDRPPEATLRIDSLSSPGRFRDVSLEVRRGEIVGLAGQIGSGRSSVLRALFGLDRSVSGTIVVDGREVAPRSVRDAIRNGMALISEDRRRDGLALDLTVLSNLTVVRFPSRFAIYRRRAARRIGREAAQKVELQKGPQFITKLLSGGNQQKVAVGKWIAARPRVLLCDEPTTGIDIGARGELYDVLRALADDGVAVVVASSDLAEILTLTDRVLVMRQGRVVATMRTSDATEASLLAASVGADAEPTSLEPTGGN
jgi:rhamnose transport system ATP-binding protein